MTGPPFSRRALVGLGLGLAIAGACAERERITVTVGSDFDTLAEVREHLGRAPGLTELQAFGRRVADIDPGSIAHVRRRWETSEPSGGSARSDDWLSETCQLDLLEGEVLRVDGWLAPRTLCGIAASYAT